MYGKAFYGIAILSGIIALGMFSVFTFAQSPSFDVNWYHVEQGISHQAYNISIKNPNAVVSKNFDISVVFSNTNFDSSKIKNVKISAWQNVAHSVPVQESYQEAATCQDANNNTYACQQTKWRTVYQTQYWYEWASPTSLALNNGKKNYGITNLAANEVEWYKLEFDLPIQKNGNGWGTSGKLALFDEIDKVEYHPWFDTTFSKRKQVTIEKLPITTTNYQALLNVSYDSDMQADFDDLRFTYLNEASNTETETSFYIWHKVNSNYADVFVNVPQINTTHDSTLYTYYGNSTVSTTSSGIKTFEFFDDFSAATLNTSAWTAGGGGAAKCSLLNGTLEAQDGTTSGNGCQAVTSQTFSINTSFYFNISVANVDAVHFGEWNDAFSQGARFTTHGCCDFNQFTSYMQLHSSSAGYPNEFNKATGQGQGSFWEGALKRYGTTQLLGYTNFTANQFVSQTSGVPTSSIPLKLHSNGATNIKNTSLDYIFVAKSVSPEPNASFFSEESVTVANRAPIHSTPLFTSTTGKNLSTETLTCYNQSTSDPDGDAVTNIFSFYKNNAPLARLYMPFESNYTATKTADYSGYQNNGTISGATFTNGTVGKALQFDGVDDNVTISDANSLDITNALTIEAWINRNSNSSMILDKNLAYRLWFADSSGKISFALYTDGAWATAVSNSVVSANAWHHIAATYDGSNMKIYIDGSLDKIQAQTGSIGTSIEEITISNYKYGDFNFNGTVDEVQLYPTALTLQQITTHFNQQTNKIVNQETIGGDVFQCAVTPNDAKVDGSPLNSSSLTVLWNVTFNVTSGEDGSQISNFNFNCTSGPIVSGIGSPYSQGFLSGSYSCKFTTGSVYYDKNILVVADNDKLIDVELGKKQDMTIQEHTWLEAVYNCLINGNCTLYNTITNINDTTTKTWNQFKRTDQSIVTKEQFISLVVSNTTNLTIDYTVNIPTKEGYGVVAGLQGYDDFLPIRISYWFLDPTNTTCYNQGTKPTGVENPYCQPLTIQTVGRINTAMNFTVDLRPTLPSGNYTVVRSVEIDPVGQWIDYGQEIVGKVEVKEANNNILAKITVPASYVAEALKEAAGALGPTGLFIWKFITPDVFALIALTIIGYLFGSRNIGGRFRIK